MTLIFSVGVLEYWSIGVLKEGDFQHSNTPTLQSVQISLISPISVLLKINARVYRGVIRKQDIILYDMISGRTQEHLKKNLSRMDSSYSKEHRTM